MTTKRPRSSESVRPFAGLKPLRAARAALALFSVVLGLALSASQVRAEGVDEEEPRLEPGLYLSWHSPYGQDGATDRLSTACDDTTEIDTLYLSFVVPRARSALVSMTGTLYFYPQEGDTLDRFWFFKRGWDNETNLRIDMDHIAGFPCYILWEAVGTGGVSYDHRSGRGRLDFEFHAEERDAVLAQDDRMYCFARVMIRQKRNFLTGCHQPVCIEFAEASFRNRGTNVVPLEIRGGDHRFVTWNSPDGRICDAARAKSRVKSWQPGATPAARKP